MMEVKVSKDSPEMKFEFLIGDVNWESYGGTWISDKLNNGDFDYWLVIEFINMLDATGDPDLMVCINAVSPSEAQGELANALSGYGDELIEQAEADPILQVEALHYYGVYAQLWTKTVPLTEDQADNEDYDDLAESLVKEARQVATVCAEMFGFFMDQQMNRLGATGWEVIGGDLMGSTFREYQAEAEAERQLQAEKERVRNFWIDN